MKTCFTESATAHSVKPDSFYQLIHKYFDGKKIDIFARQVREGFDGWGNEYGSIQLDIKKPASALKSPAKKSNKKQAELFDIA